VRESAESGKLTFRVRCIQPGSATSPLCFQTLTLSPEMPPVASGESDGDRSFVAIGRLTAWARGSGARCGSRAIRKVRYPESSAKLRRPTPAIESVPAKARRLQRRGWTKALAAAAAVTDPPRAAGKESRARCASSKEAFPAVDACPLLARHCLPGLPRRDIIRRGAGE